MGVLAQGKERYGEKMLRLTPLLLFTTMFVATASAQETGKLDKIVLEAKTGSVMTSTGGQYLTADVGKQLVDGENMMLGDGSDATVVYYYLDDDGNLERKCTEKYRGADTYVIDDSCVVAVLLPSGSRAAAGIIIGAGLIGAAIIGNDEVSPEPLSSGPNGSIRHF